MIFDRTQYHIIRSKEILENKIKKGIDLTEDEAECIRRGFFTVDTINRISSKIIELHSALEDLGYTVYELLFNKESFSIGDFFNDTDFTLLFQNALGLERSYYGEESNIIDSINQDYSFESINRLERFLYELDNKLQEEKNNEN